ncbi:hypothetical protein DRL37_23560 [Salmonella enterica subsp. enterica serovar Leeuwarden]|uniref:Uncharacterized protein n=2 Tax=Salmonella enterica TaxID=28901 RepID=A0A754KU14_SALER|nr:hypothetical protein [Salmonella enterica]EBL5686447.1 hypothetical protein [Salmonella enterica subsp. enterica serovar Typhimurium]EBR8936778.1 hypothetical protein [Salmonella enterica subsp. enterica serovar Muenchen]EBS1485642.1 hypothetical protein [Salmonella enterica subsp. enterica serovar Manhattan]EBX2843115.1 hypothetical protein [Salmonella enterica subsp. enterica serovar Leeuwarden]ECG1703145.1 hypothetical protein [Salmonella enterica subsp. enterica]EDA5900951.1 hypothetic
MSSMLDPQQYNKDMRKKQIDLMLSTIGPMNEKSAFLMALMIKLSDDPAATIKEIGDCLDAVYGAGENTDNSTGSTFSEMRLMYSSAVTIYHKIKNI